MKAAFAVLVLVGGVAGCAGGGTVCTGGTTVSLSPLAGAADHSAAAPGNQQKFTAGGVPTAQSGCAVPAHTELLTPVWTSSDPLDVTVSSAQDATNGVATCVNSTAQAVTLTASGAVGTMAYKQTVTLACK